MILPAVIGIVLGVAFDMKELLPGYDHIYNEDECNRSKVAIPRTFTRSAFKHIESSSEVGNFLDINGEFSLKMKSGKMTVNGIGDYFREQVDREKTVEILLTVYHETVTETFPSYLEPNTEWMRKKPDQVGTHYVRSITYGGQLIISYQIKAESSEYLEQIKAAVKANIRNSGSVDFKLAGDLEKINEQTKEKSSTSIFAYATTAAFNPPQDLNSTFDLIDRYPSMVEAENYGLGQPIKMEIVPLGTLNPNYTSSYKQDATRTIMDEALAKFDDLQLAQKKLEDIYNIPDIPENIKKEVDAFYDVFRKASLEMSTAIDQLDLSQETNITYFDKAFAAYIAGGLNMPNKYQRECTRLLNLINNVTAPWYPYTRAVTHYIHWGAGNCTLPSPKPLMIGLAASSPSGFGNGVNLQCLDLSDPKFEIHSLGSEILVSGINGLTYEAPGGQTGPLFCAHCQLENATSVLTVPAKNHCPQGMKLEYSGYFATGTEVISEPVCIDWNRDESIDNFHPQADYTANSLKPLWIKCEGCEEGEYNYIPCVVCSR